MADQDLKDSLESGEEVDTSEEEDETSQGEQQPDNSQQSEGDNTSDDTDTSGGESDDSDSDDSDSSGDDEGDSDESETESQFDKSFSQFDVDGTDEGYVKRLERAYQKSSEEAIRLNHENQNLKNGQPVQQPQAGQNDQGQQQQQGQQGQQGQQDPNAAPPQQGEDPVIVHMRTQMNQQADQDLAEFRKEHPEIDTDPEVRDNVNKYIKFYSQYTFNNEGRLPGMRESLDAAYKHFDYDDNKDEKVANQTKQNASNANSGSKPKKSAGSKKDSTEPTEDEKYYAQKMGLSVDRIRKRKKEDQKQQQT